MWRASLNVKLQVLIARLTMKSFIQLWLSKISENTVRGKIYKQLPSLPKKSCQKFSWTNFTGTNDFNETFWACENKNVFVRWIWHHPTSFCIRFGFRRKRKSHFEADLLLISYSNFAIHSNETLNASESCFSTLTLLKNLANLEKPILITLNKHFSLLPAAPTRLLDG